MDMQECQSDFARALRDPDLALPTGVASHNSDAPRERFAVYRNNVMVGLVGALEARFPATRRIAGEDFFKGAAKLFAATQPPRSPLMMFYGDEFPAFLADFEPAREVPYLPGVARLEAARTRAYHAADAKPLTPAALSGGIPDDLAGTRFILHPSVEIVEFGLSYRHDLGDELRRNRPCAHNRLAWRGRTCFAPPLRCRGSPPAARRPDFFATPRRGKSAWRGGCGGARR